jgi:hypothetical protein
MRQKEIIEEAFEKYKIFVGDEEESVFLETQIIDIMKKIFTDQPLLEEGN